MEAKDMIEDKTIDPLQSTVWRLLVKKPFYAHVLMGMKRSYTTSIPTLGVGVSSEINLLVNKKFLESLTPKERAAVLEHEVLHLINGHLERYQKEMNKMKFNIAADIAINQYIPDLPIYNEELKKNGGFLPQHFDLPDNQTTEFYYNKLRDEDMQKVKNMVEGKGGDGEENGEGENSNGENSNGESSSQCHGTVDEHQIWEDADLSTTNDSQYVHEKIQQTIKKALEKTPSECRGNLPSGIQRMINDCLKPLIHWENVLKKFLNYATEVKIKSTRKKPNRRFGYYYSGLKKDYKLSCSVIIDTSGSMSQEILGKIWTELNRLKTSFPNIMVYECDSIVHQKYKFNKNTKPNLKGGGGTDFVDAFKQVEKDKQDVCVIFTDGYDGSTLPKQKVPTLFVEPKGGPKNYDWAKYTFINEWEN